MRKLIFIFMFAVVFGAAQSIQAQTPAQQDFIERARMVAEIEKLRELNASKDTVIAEKDKQIETYEKMNTVQEARITDLKAALASADRVDALVDLRETAHREQTQFYKDEVGRLRDENAKLRKSRDRRSMIFGAIGAAAGAFIFR